MRELSLFEKKLLDNLQKDFPLCPRPFFYIAQKLGCKEEDILESLKNLKKEGFLRFLGPSFDSKRLGFITTLCALAVPASEAENIARFIAGYPEVTHCYLRKHEKNIWFTLVAHNEKRIKEIFKDIYKNTGFKPEDFPALKLFKLRAVFSLEKADDSKDTR